MELIGPNPDPWHREFLESGGCFLVEFNSGKTLCIDRESVRKEKLRLGYMFEAIKIIQVSSNGEMRVIKDRMGKF